MAGTKKNIDKNIPKKSKKKAFKAGQHIVYPCPRCWESDRN